MFRYLHHSKSIATALAATLTAVILVPDAAAEQPHDGPETASLSAPDDDPDMQVGDKLDRSSLHVVTRPGLYGIGSPPAGSRYGVIDGRLIRYDPQNDRLLSIIREVEDILD